MENTYIPSLEEYEMASERLWKFTTENDYFHSYQNMVFLQKKAKTSLRKKQSAEDDASLMAMEFPAESERVYFNQFDSYKNESMFVSDWMEMVRISFLYMHYAVNGI